MFTERTQPGPHTGQHQPVQPQPPENVKPCLIYKIPAEPSRYRVAIWRRFKERGAVYLQDSVCLLPDTPPHREFFQDLAQEIEVAQGESLLLLVEVEEVVGQERIIERFNTERDAEYGEFLEQCEAFLEERPFRGYDLRRSP